MPGDSASTKFLVSRYERLFMVTVWFQIRVCLGELTYTETESWFEPFPYCSSCLVTYPLGGNRQVLWTRWAEFTWTLLGTVRKRNRFVRP